MSLLDGIRHRLYVLWRGDRYGQEVEREMRFHLELDGPAGSATDETLRDAELQARRNFGNATYYREEVRRMTIPLWFDAIRQDLGYAWRGIKRSPGFTVAVVATLGLGIGVNTAIFSFLDRVFAQVPEGVATPNGVRRLYIDGEVRGARESYDSFTFPAFRAIVAAVDSSVQVAAFTMPDSAAIIEGDSNIPLRRSAVTGDYFRLLGVRPQRGRFFVDAETRIETRTPVAVLSDAFWRRAFQADTGILGRTVAINYRPYIIVGVAAPRFTGVDINAVDVWLPANTYSESRGLHGEPWYETFQSSFAIIARTPTGFAEARLTGPATTALRSVHLDGYYYDSTQTAVAGPIIRALGPATRSQELSISTRLAGVALIVLLIACANIANLLLVRATRRRREIALRRALGVSTRRLYGQLFVESSLLSLLGGTVGLLFAVWGGFALRRLLLPSNQWARGAVDARTVLFALGVSLVVGLLAGLAPAMHATRPGLIDSLKVGAREGAYQRSRLRSGLLIIQTALSVVLLVGAGLFVRSLQNIRQLDLGYDVENTLIVYPSFPLTRPDPQVLATGLANAAERVQTAPGVEAVAIANAGPMRGVGFGPFFLPGRDSLPRLGDERGPSVIAVSPGFFRASGVALLAGRDFSASDSRDAASVLIVSRAMARLYWPGESALGKCVKLGKRDGPCSTVVGVVADVHRMKLIEKATLQFYRPWTQASGFLVPTVMIIRTLESNTGPVAQLSARELRRVLPSMAPPVVRTVAQYLEPQLRPWRMGAQLFAALGVLALCVAAIGVYSVVAYSASQRTHEMGIRVALGAEARDIVSLVLREGSSVVLVGVVIGIAAALAAGRLISSLLFGVGARDPVVLSVTAIALVVVGIVASALPGIRAAHVDPVTALRAE